MMKELSEFFVSICSMSLYYYMHYEKELPKSGKLDHIGGLICFKLEIEKLKIIMLKPL